MGYLSDIVKQLKDEQEVIFVGTGVLIVDEQGRVLIAERTDNQEWCIPGGSLEVGESLTHCAVRETYEETGIVIQENDLILNAAVSVPEIIIKNGRNIHIVSVSYWTKVYDNTDMQMDSREFTKYGWFTKEEAHKLPIITPYTREAFKVYFGGEW